MAILERELSNPARYTGNIDDIADKVYGGERLAWDDGRRLFHHHNLPELAALADHARRSLNPDDVVTYVVEF